ncbi:MAG: preprotein translocase subunit SecE [Hyphomicrobiales bacterium]
MARQPRRRAGTAPTTTPGGEASARRVRENLPRPAAAPTRAASPGGQAPVVKRRRNPFGFLSALQPRFVADIISELKKVTWPSFNETRYLTIVVAIVATAVGLLLGGVDLVFGWAIEKLFF